MMNKISLIGSLKIILFLLLINITAIVLFEFSGFSMLKLIFTLFMIVAEVVLFINFFNELRFKNDIGLYFRITFGLLLLWTMIIIFRSFSFNSKDIITLIGHHRVGAMSWLTPLAVVFGFQLVNWIKLFNFIEKILIGGVLLGISFFPFRHENGIEDWLHFIPVILLTAAYQKKRTNVILILSIGMLILLSITSSHRTNFVYILVIFSFYTIEFLKNEKINIFKKLIAYLFLFFTFLVVLVNFSPVYEKIMSDKDVSDDTRTFLFEELFDDMSRKELIIGRGVLGTYYSPYFQLTKDEGREGDSPIRSESEVGYLFMILKGGFILMALYLLILIPAAFLGIYRSNNVVAKMCGYYIVLYLLMWPLSYSPTFVPKFIILWMAVGTCMSPKARSTYIKMSNFKHI